MPIETIEIKDATGVSRTIAADELGGLFYQVFKLAFGADGALSLVDAANPLPVRETPKLGAGASDVVALAANATEIAAANANRDALVLSVPSTHTEPVWFGLDNAPVLGEGIEVQPGGALVVGRRAALYWVGQIWAISAPVVNLGRLEVSSA